jgi:hypothetical protein
VTHITERDYPLLNATGKFGTNEVVSIQMLTIGTLLLRECMCKVLTPPTLLQKKEVAHVDSRLEMVEKGLMEVARVP